MVMYLAISIMSFTSCGDDDDGFWLKGAKVNGQITAEEEGETTTYYAYDEANWHTGYSKDLCHWSPNGATFLAYLSEEVPSEVTKFDDCLIYDKDIYWQFYTTGEVKQGTEIQTAGIFWHALFHPSNYCCDDDYHIKGKVIVKSIKNDRITLQFKNFRFRRETEFRMGNSSYQDVTVNGEITYTLED